MPRPSPARFRPSCVPLEDRLAPAAPADPAPTDRAASADVVFLTPDGQRFGAAREYSEQYTGGPPATGGMWVVRGDLTGDGVSDTITAPGAGIIPAVFVYDGITGAAVRSFLAFEKSFKGGVFATTGDFNRDGKTEIVASPDQSGGPRVRVFDGEVFERLVADFLAIADDNFRGGVRAAVGDVNGDGVEDLIACAGFGGGPRVAVYDGKSVAAGDPKKLVPDFFVFEEGLRNGAYVTVGYVDGDGYADLIFGGGPGGAPRVRVLSGKALAEQGPAAALAAPIGDFFAGSDADRGGVRVGTVLGEDGLADVVAVGAAGDGFAYEPATGAKLRQINRDDLLHGGMIDDEAARLGSAPLAARDDAFEAALLGTYAGTFLDEFAVSLSGQGNPVRLTGEVQVTLEVLNLVTSPLEVPETREILAPPIPFARAKKDGGEVPFLGRVTVRVGGKPDLVSEVTGAIRVDPFPAADAPAAGTLRFAQPADGGEAGGTVSGDGFAWTPAGLTGNGLRARVEGQYEINPPGRPFVLAKGATPPVPGPPVDVGLHARLFGGTYSGRYTTQVTIANPFEVGSREVTATLQVGNLTLRRTTPAGAEYGFTGQLTLAVASRPDQVYTVTGTIFAFPPNPFSGSNIPMFPARFDFTGTGAGGTVTGTDLRYLNATSFENQLTALRGTQLSATGTGFAVGPPTQFVLAK